MHPQTLEARARVLLVDDEPDVTRGIQLALRKEPFHIECADSAQQALELLGNKPFDAVVSDERMPGIPGSELLAIVRKRHPEVARIILSGHANMEAMLRSINSAEIYRFLIKPCPPEEIGLTIREALAARESRRRFEAWESEQLRSTPAVRALEFERALQGLWIGFQPILLASTGLVYGYEALLRSDDADWPGALAFLARARKQGRSQEAGRHIRSLVADSMDLAPTGSVIFVNLNPDDLDDDDLMSGRESLTKHARGIVLEITERDSLKSLSDLDCKVKLLRDLGYRIAIDDLGAGYAGLTSLALVLPDVVKFDMDLVRDIDRSPTKQALIRSMAGTCRDLGIQTLAEGIESVRERDVVVGLGCALLQGFLLGKPARKFLQVDG